MRIDKYLADKFGSRTKCAEAIEKGLVKVNGKTVVPSYDVKEDDNVEISEAEEHFVSNGGYKLSKAIKDFNFSVKGKIFADIGASNGGFTDCLLQNGASKVYCIDVGESQLDGSLRGKNVVIIDNFNARNLTSDLFKDKLDGIVIDVSFISLTYILEAVGNVLLDESAEVIALIKPQFECESKNVGKNGIVKKPEVHERVLKKIYDFALKCNLFPVNLTTAPIVQGKNIEYLIHLDKRGVYKPFQSLLNNVII